MQARKLGLRVLGASWNSHRERPDGVGKDLHFVNGSDGIWAARDSRGEGRAPITAVQGVTRAKQGQGLKSSLRPIQPLSTGCICLGKRHPCQPQGMACFPNSHKGAVCVCGQEPHEGSEQARELGRGYRIHSCVSLVEGPVWNWVYPYALEWLTAGVTG